MFDDRCPLVCSTVSSNGISIGVVAEGSARSRIQVFSLMIWYGRTHIPAHPDTVGRGVNAGKFLNATQPIDAEGLEKLLCSQDFFRCRRFCAATNNGVTGITDRVQILSEFVFSGSEN
jgi:hypothetical protein